jgi:hypothetical protein
VGDEPGLILGEVGCDSREPVSALEAMSLKESDCSNQEDRMVLKELCFQ